MIRTGSVQRRRSYCMKSRSSPCRRPRMNRMSCSLHRRRSSTGYRRHLRKSCNSSMASGPPKFFGGNNAGRLVKFKD